MDFKKRIGKLEKKANWLRNKVLDMAVRAGAGHIAPSFSCAEILVALHHGGGLKVKPKDPKWENRDRFILSKGHAAVALYAILADLGFFPISELNLFAQPGGFLGCHAENFVLGVEAFTGSLGHGLPIACGTALGAKMDEKKFKIVALLGDGECHEGSVWEAAMFAGQHKLDNLLVVVDNNEISGTDFLPRYLDIEPLQDKWKSFGWETVAIDGHSFEELLPQIKKFRNGHFKKPFVIIAKTVKGKGVSFMENRPIWHYRIPVGKELTKARRELRNKE